MSEHRFPQVHVIRTIEQDGRTISEPVSSPVCDFCGNDSPAWDYDCHDFVTDIPILASTGGWAACTPCSDMIEADDWSGLLERCLMAACKLGRQHYQGVVIGAPLMHNGFRENRYGERRAWG
jgi:hypothetical protein